MWLYDPLVSWRLSWDTLPRRERGWRRAKWIVFSASGNRGGGVASGGAQIGRRAFTYTLALQRLGFGRIWFPPVPPLHLHLLLLTFDGLSGKS
jgi:hypothetical protein